MGDQKSRVRIRLEGFEMVDGVRSGFSPEFPEPAITGGDGEPQGATAEEPKRSGAEGPQGAGASAVSGAWGTGRDEHALVVTMEDGSTQIDHSASARENLKEAYRGLGAGAIIGGGAAALVSSLPGPVLPWVGGAVAALPALVWGIPALIGGLGDLAQAGAHAVKHALGFGFRGEEPVTEGPEYKHPWE
jgi:hypothetical protein